MSDTKKPYKTNAAVYSNVDKTFLYTMSIDAKLYSELQDIFAHMEIGGRLCWYTNKYKTEKKHPDFQFTYKTKEENKSFPPGMTRSADGSLVKKNNLI